MKKFFIVLIMHVSLFAGQFNNGTTFEEINFLLGTNGFNMSCINKLNHEWFQNIDSIIMVDVNHFSSATNRASFHYLDHSFTVQNHSEEIYYKFDTNNRLINKNVSQENGIVSSRSFNITYSNDTANVIYTNGDEFHFVENNDYTYISILEDGISSKKYKVEYDQLLETPNRRTISAWEYGIDPDNFSHIKYNPISFQKLRDFENTCYFFEEDTTHQITFVCDGENVDSIYTDNETWSITYLSFGIDQIQNENLYILHYKMDYNEDGTLTNITTPDYDRNIWIYMNPTPVSISKSIKHNYHLTSEHAIINIYGINGRLLQTLENANINNLNLKLSKGVYFAEVPNVKTYKISIR